MTRRVIAVLRASSDSQDVRRQHGDIARVARAHNLEVIRTLELVGVSGTAVLDNSQIQHVLADLERPEVDGVALSALDRLFRPKRYGHFAILDRFCDQRKKIWSAREGEVDPLTDEGYDKCISAGGRAGAEWRELRRRTMQGKEVLRTEGRHVNGDVTLPRGVAYDKHTGKWSYREPDAARVARMFRLVLQGYSLHRIAEVVGGWTHMGVMHALRNPIYGLGTRVYPADGQRQEPLIVKVIDQPLVSTEVWHRVQALLDSRSDRWRQTKRPPRFLGSGLLRCGICGKAVYVRGKGRPTSHDMYICASRHPGGSGCGMRSLWREVVDEAVERLVAEQLASGAVLRAVLRARAERAPDKARDSAAAQKALEAKRERILEQRADGLISREACNAKASGIDRELAALRAELPRNPLAALDLARLARGIAGEFRLFRSMPFAKKRELLQRAVAEIILADGQIPSLTLRGGFLSEMAGVNLEARSTSPCWLRCPAPG
jgi:hypothetical protein